MLEPMSEVTMDGFLSSSFPGAAPPPKRLQPPRAPLRKPSDVSWDVPPLALPEAPRKGKLPHGSFASTFDEECPPLEEKSDDSGEEDEPAIFALDGGGAEDDDDGENTFQLAGFDDGLDDPVASGGRGYSDKDAPPAAPAPGSSYQSMSGRMRAASMSQSLGASPILMSVLEQVAASQTFRRQESW